MLEVFTWGLIIFLIIVGAVICILLGALAWLAIWLIWETIMGI